MDRTIEYRGQDIETKEWYYGGIYQKGNEFYIVDGTGRNNLRAVIKESVGQYTGVKDKCGKKIYEGDIIEEINFEEKYYQVVFYDYGFKLKNLSKEFMIFTSRYSDFCEFEFNIIRNIYENQNLLQQKEQ